MSWPRNSLKRIFTLLVLVLRSDILVLVLVLVQVSWSHHYEFHIIILTLIPTDFGSYAPVVLL